MREAAGFPVATAGGSVSLLALQRNVRAPVLAGDRSWNTKVVCDATVLMEGQTVRVWFGGGDVAHPAENIHGQIGYGELRWNPAKR